MHEFAICRTIVDSVLKELNKLGPGCGRLISARIVAGALHGLVPDNLISAYEVLTKNTAAEGSKLDIEKKPITARCRRCGWTGEVREFVFLCGSCGTGGIEMTGGKELYLDNMKIEQYENA